MGKLIKAILVVLGLSLFTGGVAFAAPTLSVRLEQPKSPTNQRDFGVVFTTLDAQNNPVSVSCYKKGPSDGSFSQFDSTKSLPNGGGTDNCQVTSSLASQDGTYAFYVVASDGTTTVQSDTVTVDINTSGPGTPTNYSKNQPDSCHYVISFTTANDSGKTAYVEIYRSSTTTLVANASSRITSISVGSNTNKTYTDNIPSCGTTYFYAVRAFDSAGNASGLVGDGELTATTSTTTNNGTTPAPTSAAAHSEGAIPVTTSGVTPGAGESLTGTPAPSGTQQQGVLGATKAPTQSPSGTAGFFSSKKNWLLLLGIIVLLGLTFWYWQRRSR